jgi:hypothetical protein
MQASRGWRDLVPNALPYRRHRTNLSRRCSSVNDPQRAFWASTGARGKKALAQWRWDCSGTIVESRSRSRYTEPRRGRRTALTFPLLPPPQKN